MRCVWRIELASFSVIRVVVAGPVASVVVNRFGYRISTVIGSLMSATGLIISAFTSNVATLYFSYGVLGGMLTETSLFMRCRDGSVGLLHLSIFLPSLCWPSTLAKQTSSRKNKRFSTSYCRRLLNDFEFVVHYKHKEYISSCLYLSDISFMPIDFSLWKCSPVLRFYHAVWFEKTPIWRTRGGVVLDLISGMRYQWRATKRTSILVQKKNVIMTTDG